jgi:hypothetical protein
MQYILLIHSDERAAAAATPEQNSEMMAAYMAYSQALVDAKAMVGGNRLRPTSTATSVRVANGKTAIQDGPFADTKEQLGGYYLIEAADLDAALSWAARCPGARHGTVEVRPIWQM